VSEVTIGATGDPLGKSDVENLAVVGIVITGDGFRGKPVPLCHFCVGVTGTAATGIIFPGGGLISLQGGIVIRGIVQAVTVRAGGGIGVSFEEGAAVPEEGVVLAAVALTAVFHYRDLEPLSRFPYAMDVLMTVPALKVLFYIVDILSEPGGDIPVTAPAVYRSGFVFPGHVAAEVGNVRMAAHTGVSAVSGSLKTCLIEGIVVTGLTIARRP
jgi:hypothetical protein